MNYGESNPMFKGDEAGIAAVHEWVKRRRPKPDLCEICKLAPAVDLANRSGRYLRNLNDWDYMCRKCHMDSDGRNEQLRKSGKSRKLPNKICKFCGLDFHPSKRSVEFCSRKCYFAAGGSHHEQREKRV